MAIPPGCYLDAVVRVFTFVEEDEAFVVDETAATDDEEAVGIAAVAAAGAAVPVETPAAFAVWLCSACLPIKALSAMKPATPTVVTRRFQT